MDLTWKGRTLSIPYDVALFIKDRWPFLSSSGHHPAPVCALRGVKDARWQVWRSLALIWTVVTTWVLSDLHSGVPWTRLHCVPVELICYLLFLACLPSSYPGNKSILKEMVLSWCDAFGYICIVTQLSCIWHNVLITLHFHCIAMQFQALKMIFLKSLCLVHVFSSSK